MIKSLYIKNFIIFDEINIDFNDGFSVFTGETGAGKSIMVDAINLLCASRSSSSLVAKDKDYAIIEGVFDFSNLYNVKNILNELHIEEYDNVIICREIKNDGKSIMKINRRTVNLSFVKEIMDLCIDIHSQHDTQYLLKSINHINLLDNYVNDFKLINKVKEKFEVYKSIKNEIEELNKNYNEDDVEYFQSCIDDIDDAELVIGEDDILKEKEKQYENITKNYEHIMDIINLYDEIQPSLYEINKSFQRIDEEEIQEINEDLQNAYYNFDDSMERIKDFINSLDIDEYEINQVQERLYTINKLKRKYGSTIEEILEYKEELIEKIDIINNRQSYIDKMNIKLKEAHNEFIEYAKKLSLKRKEYCKKLDLEIMETLNDLMLPNAKFKTNITETNDNILGIDKVEFLISMNKGEDLKPLSKVASGGELSRLMLGLKTIFSKLQGISTIIFDEIDTGVSGPVATSIGQKMKSLSKNTQVISITHLAQVAACANNHYHVLKTEENNKTKTMIKQLTYDEKIKELAIISNGDITENSINAAKELYKNNQGI